MKLTMAVALLNSTAELKVVEGRGKKEDAVSRTLTTHDVPDFPTLARRLNFRVDGNSSEAPIVLAAAKAGLLSVDLSQHMPALKTTPEVPFSSKRKCMASVVSVR